MAAYLVSSDGRAKNEASIRENLPPYAEIHTASFAQHGDTDHAEDALRKQLHRDVEREDLRQFRLSRIQNRIVFATEREDGDFEVPEDFERRLAGPRAPWQLGEPDQTARIRVPRHVFDAARASYGEAVSLQEENGLAVLATRYTGEPQLAGWILSLGEDAEVLSPDSLVDRTVEGLERLVAAHEEKSS